MLSQGPQAEGDGESVGRVGRSKRSHGPQLSFEVFGGWPRARKEDLKVALGGASALSERRTFKARPLRGGRLRSSFGIICNLQFNFRRMAGDKVATAQLQTSRARSSAAKLFLAAAEAVPIGAISTSNFDALPPALFSSLTLFKHDLSKLGATMGGGKNLRRTHQRGQSAQRSLQPGGASGRRESQSSRHAWPPWCGRPRRRARARFQIGAHTPSRSQTRP